MPPPARRPDPQTDYQDPIDRLYRRRPGKKGEKREKSEQTPSSAASVAYAFGFIGLVPCLGLIFSPLAVLFGIIGLAQTRDPKVSGKGRAKSGLWFGLVGIVLNLFLSPMCLYLFGVITGKVR